ncbi:hypothetical protein NEAUS07_0694 [Nematocida ausubeli]|uniref:Srp40 C-terminal domain-containing protein n=1 Tax=Nematocida ausubeli (strain ATCC PRA-371 / ERTm2) TaxID=1913371 RepID=H8ZFG1_NEMA1|nr:hypothetical protein NERG_02332 [Nematocida ausubeli]KAI5134081.1 hypothetical protein NEAUS07_0694 [Nematocida ausubeli]
MARAQQELLTHSKRSGGHLKPHKGKNFNREKKKLKKGVVKLGKIDTAVKSIKFDD